MKPLFLGMLLPNVMAPRPTLAAPRTALVVRGDVLPMRSWTPAQLQKMAPVRLVVPGDKKPMRWVRNLVALEITDGKRLREARPGDKATARP